MSDYLSIKADRYGGVVVKVVGEAGTAPDFDGRLSSLLSDWRDEGYKHVFLTLPKRCATLIPVAVAHGFDFHHSSDGHQSGDSYLILAQKLSEAYIIHAATHYAAIGAVVVNEKNELLVVSELVNGRDSGKFKLPGGYLDPGESMAAAAEREVFEETGIKCRFESLHNFRHLFTTATFGKGGFYFICRLALLGGTLTPEPEEIAVCKWMAVDDFLSSPDVYDFDKGLYRGTLTGGLKLTEIAGYERDLGRVELLFPHDWNKDEKR
ncbi:MAG: NUDIX domain-containing protein [Methylococcales bacterium]|nr:NUDIX domain-containing protein [Methylococcales bacterium]